MQPAPAGRVLQASARALEEVEVDGRRAWALAGDVAAMQTEVEVTVEPFAKLPAAPRREVADEGDRLGAVLDAPARVAWVRS